MNLLAIETATEFCSVALLTDGGLLTRAEFAPRRHTELLLPMCEDVLAEAGLARSALDAIAVGRGPGAFTGVRLAIAAAQGMALGLDLPVVAISSLAALALDAPVDGSNVLALIDARMGEVYAGAFRRTESGLLEPLGAECVTTAETLEWPAAGDWSVIGSGWDTYQEVLLGRLAAPPRWADGARFPQAAAVARLAEPIARAGGGVAAELALPVYLRDKVAQTLQERGKAS